MARYWQYCATASGLVRSSWYTRFFFNVRTRNNTTCKNNSISHTQLWKSVLHQDYYLYQDTTQLIFYCFNLYYINVLYFIIYMRASCCGFLTSSLYSVKHTTNTAQCLHHHNTNFHYQNNCWCNTGISSFSHNMFWQILAIFKLL